MDRQDIVTAELAYSKLPENITVQDKNGKALPVQIIGHNNDTLKFIFLAHVPSVGLEVFDVKEINGKSKPSSELTVTDRSLENEYYKVKVADNGDILSIYDKKASKEILAKPARLEFLFEHPTDYPAWNMDWKDRQNPPIDYLDKNASISIVEQGPVRVALQVKREGRNSIITQTLSLAAGDAGKHLEVTNKIDWQSREVSLKASFPLTVSNENATYNLGAGTIERSTNNPKKYEVPSKEWFDLTDSTGSYGVSILEDCKFGSDKPDNNTVRLTLLYTPKSDASNNSFSFQGTQDWGIHDFRYGVYGHSGDWRKGESQWRGRFFNQPLLAFETSKHEGSLGKEISLLRLSSPEAGLMAFKKMEDGDHYIVRVNELSGKDVKDLSITFPGKIIDAYEVNGQEQKIEEPVKFDNNKLNFDLSHYTIRSFAVKFAPSTKQLAQVKQTEVTLPYNHDAFSFDDNRDDGRFGHWNSYPAELLPSEIVSEDIHFKTGSTVDGDNNVVQCQNQTINLPEGNYNKLYVLAAADDDIQSELKIDGQQRTFNVQQGTGYVGQFYNRVLTPDNNDVVKIVEPYTKRADIAWFASHKHIPYPSKNDTYQYCYMYKFEIDLPKDARTVTLPDNKKIKIFAMTVADVENEEAQALQPLYDDFNENETMHLRNNNN